MTSLKQVIFFLGIIVALVVSFYLYIKIDGYYQRKAFKAKIAELKTVSKPIISWLNSYYEQNKYFPEKLLPEYEIIINSSIPRGRYETYKKYIDGQPRHSCKITFGDYLKDGFILFWCNKSGDNYWMLDT